MTVMVNRLVLTAFDIMVQLQKFLHRPAELLLLILQREKRILDNFRRRGA